MMRMLMAACVLREARHDYLWHHEATSAFRSRVAAVRRSGRRGRSRTPPRAQQHGVERVRGSSPCRVRAHSA